MLSNLKLVLSQHKRFLAIFVFIVFLPSIILAIFGISAIHNERYKLEQLNLDQHRRFVRDLQAYLLSIIERNAGSLTQISLSQAYIDQDYLEIQNLIARLTLDKSLNGIVVLWGSNGKTWIPNLQPVPSLREVHSVPDEWLDINPEVELAEKEEFQSENYSRAITRYQQLLSRTNDIQTKAWLQNRIARCEVKRKNYDRALVAYQAILDRSPDVLTESGRPMGIVSELEILDVLRSNEQIEEFFFESLKTYQDLAQNAWSLDGDQLIFYNTILAGFIDEVANKHSLLKAPVNYERIIAELRQDIEDKLNVWKMINSIELDLSSNSVQMKNYVRSGIPQIQKSVIDSAGEDIVVLYLSNTGEGSRQFHPGYLGLVIQSTILEEPINTFLTSNPALDSSVYIRSSQTGNLIYGDEMRLATDPVVTEYFPDNFLPWRVEIYQPHTATKFVLYQNIFFWTILALLLILFLGSGLIIRTLIQEVNLLNLKSDFIASVSHEFKTPLTAMGAILERLQSGEVEGHEKTQEYYRILSHDSDKLKRLVKNVLDFTKVEKGKREYKLVSSDISSLVRREVDSFEQENKLSGFEIELKTDRNSIQVLADEEALNQAFHNILDNAAKFSELNNKIQVEIIRNNETVEIVVQDWGIGITEYEKKKIFDKFYRGKEAASVSPTGTGLGLTLVKHIIEAHKGEVKIQSQPGEGSRVSLILPLEKGE